MFTSAIFVFILETSNRRGFRFWEQNIFVSRIWFSRRALSSILTSPRSSPCRTSSDCRSWKVGLEPSMSLRQKRQEELRNRWTSQSRKIGLQTMTVLNASQITTCLNFNNLSNCTENESKVDLRPIKLFNKNGFKQYFLNIRLCI